jgi:hypothetical protein
MIEIPAEAVKAMKAEILRNVDRFGLAEVTGLVYQTLDWHWLLAHNLAAAKRVSTQPPYNNEFVIYRPRLEGTKCQP